MEDNNISNNKINGITHCCRKDPSSGALFQCLLKRGRRGSFKIM